MFIPIVGYGREIQDGWGAAGFNWSIEVDLDVKNKLYNKNIDSPILP